jgi:hypothetical protein
MSVKNSSDTIGNRTRDVPVCSAVPQPTAPPRAPFCHSVVMKIYKPKIKIIGEVLQKVVKKMLYKCIKLTVLTGKQFKKIM